MLHKLLSKDERTIALEIAAQAAATVQGAATTGNGTQSILNADGTRTVSGPNLTEINGATVTTATHVGDVTPPGVPTGITVATKSGILTVDWDGTLDGGVPGDFDHITVYAVDSGGSAGAPLGKLSRRGTVTTADLTAGEAYDIYVTSEDDACNADGTPAHNVSPQLGPVNVTISEAAEAVTQYVWHDDDGLHISQTGDHDLTGLNMLLTASKMALRHVSTELATFSSNLIELGKNSVSAVIKLCGGTGIIRSDAFGTGRMLSITASNVGVSAGADGVMSLNGGSALGGKAKTLVRSDITSGQTSHKELGSNITQSGTDIAIKMTQMTNSSGAPNVEDFDINLHQDANGKVNLNITPDYILIAPRGGGGVSYTTSYVASLLEDTGWVKLNNKVFYRAYAGLLFIRVEDFVLPNAGWVKFGTVPAKYRPKNYVYAAVCASENGVPANIEVEASGDVWGVVKNDSGGNLYGTCAIPLN